MEEANMPEVTYGEGFRNGFARFQDKSGSGGEHQLERRQLNFAGDTPVSVHSESTLTVAGDSSKCIERDKSRLADKAPITCNCQCCAEFCDVTVTTSSGDWKLHSLLLASRSEFFYRALAGEFTESRSKVIELHLDSAEEVWPLLVDYFYRDSVTINEGNALALLALSRQLLVTSVDNYCLEFVTQHLDTSNCISYLRKAVKYNIADIQQQCIALAAQGFHFLYDADVSGLPASSVLEILRHPELLVHCEQQVLRFVLRYLATTHVEAQEAAAICSEIRFQYLDNKLLSSLTGHPQLPTQLLLSGAMGRLSTMDDPRLDVEALQPPPRATYCCDMRYRLPGGSRMLTVEIEDIWEHVAPLCTVGVSGVSEGQPGNVLRPDPDAWFETDESSEPMPWIQVVLPANMKMVHFSKYVFGHGHRRSGYFRMRNWQTLTAAEPDGPFNKVVGRPSVNEPFEVNVAKQSCDVPWRSIKLVGTDRQEDAVFRLCVRNLRLFGACEVDLLHQGDPQALVLTKTLVQKIQFTKQRRQAAAAAASDGHDSRPGSAEGMGSTNGSRRVSRDGWGMPGMFPVPGGADV